MRSESTSAFGHPRLTKPTFGTRARERDLREVVAVGAGALGGAGGEKRAAILAIMLQVRRPVRGLAGRKMLPRNVARILRNIHVALTNGDGCRPRLTPQSRRQRAD